MKENAETILQIKSVYIPLLENFLSGKLTPSQFVIQHAVVQRHDQTISTLPGTFEVLDSIWEDVEAYTAFPDPNDPIDIDEAELRACCVENLAKLKRIVAENPLPADYQA